MDQPTHCSAVGKRMLRDTYCRVRMQMRTVLKTRTDLAVEALQLLQWLRVHSCALLGTTTMHYHAGQLYHTLAGDQRPTQAHKDRTCMSYVVSLPCYC